MAATAKLRFVSEKTPMRRSLRFPAGLPIELCRRMNETPKSDAGVEQLIANTKRPTTLLSVAAVCSAEATAIGTDMKSVQSCITEAEMEKAIQIIQQKWVESARRLLTISKECIKRLEELEGREDAALTAVEDDVDAPRPAN